MKIKNSAFLVCAIFLVSAAMVPAHAAPPKPVPVILDTDIGDDIDDTWALGLLLKSPEFDVKLCVGDFGRAAYRARLLAKFLQTVGRTNIAVGVGLDVRAHDEGPQAAWIKGYELKNYPGPVRDDGVQAIVDTIMNSAEPVTLICIGPLPNIAAALEREPKIAEHARFFGMHGSLRVGYGGGKTPSAEWNVKADAASCQKVFAAPWEMTITPLDTCGLVSLDGERFARVRDSKDPIAATVIENYRIWAKHGPAAEQHSSTLFDTVAVYLAFSQDLCTMEQLGVRVTPDGFTQLDPAGKKVTAATAWKNLDAFRDLLVQRLTGPAP